MEGIRMAKKKQSLEQFLAENPFEQYHIEADILTPEEMRRHYSYLRTIANRRLSKFVGSEFEDAKSYVKNKDRFVPLKQIKSERELRYKLYELNKFIRAKSSSVTGLIRIRNRTIQTLRENGITFVNRKNIKQFGEYMDYLRAKYKGQEYDSERALSLYGQAVKKKINPFEIAEDFQFFRKHADELAKMPKIESDAKVTAEDYKKALDK